MLEPTDPVIQGCITFYSAAIYPIFDQIGEDAAKEAVDAAQELSMRYPLWMRNDKGEFPEVDIPHFGKKSSVFCLALICSYLVWVLKGQGAGNRSPLLDAALDGWKLYYPRGCPRCGQPGCSEAREV